MVFTKGHKINVGRECKLETRVKIGDANRGEKSGSWIGGCWRYWHNLARKKMEKYIGRKLMRKEIVHHKNGKWEGEENNKIENLELMSRAEHIKIHKIGEFSPANKPGAIPWNKKVS